jgi:hypothetical protein
MAPAFAGAEKESITFEDQKHLIHPNKKKKYKKKRPNRYGLFYVFSK